MKKLLSTIALTAFAAVLAPGLSAKNSEDGLWKSVTKESVANEPKVRRNSQPETAHYYTLDFALLKSKLVNAPVREQLTGQSNLIISFPNAYGEFEKYRVMESSCMEPGLEAKFPMIKTYAAQGIDDPTSFMRFSVTQFGLHTIAFSGYHSTNYVEPYTSDLSTYIVYDRHSLGAKRQDFECLTDQNIYLPSLQDNSGAKLNNPNQVAETNDQKLRTFRLAQSCTGEYAAIFMGTGTTAQQKANVQAQMTITINRVNGVYERDLAVHMNFVANNDLIIYLNSSTDPWTNEWNTKTAQTIDAVIGVNNYDIGHNFNTTGGGNAGCIACVCQSTSQTSTHKGRGYTGSSNPTGDAFDIDYVAHEMGHQFGGYHTMNTCSRSGSGQSEVEPASGSTVMGYAGICPTNIQAHSDDDFQYVNVRDISLNLQSGNSTCGVITNLTNQPPTASAGADYTIPKSTAFILEGTASDPDGNASLTYSWGENDPAQSPGNAAPVSTYTVGPMYRNLPLKTSPNRYMPDIASVIAGNLTPTWEVTPSVARTLNFSFLVRDNSAMGGQTASDLMKVTVASSGPFVITSQGSATTWTGNSTQTVTWNVASTTAAPVSCANVNIYLSTDGGYTYPTTVATNLPNNGSASITVPNIATTTGRIMVRGAGNIFYDINNANITINAAAGAAPVSVYNVASTTVCTGNAVQLTDASTNTPTSWSWSSASSTGVSFSSATAQNPTVTFANSGTYTVTLVATNASGSNSSNKVFTVNASPAVTASSTATGAVCQGTSVTLSGGGASTYSWTGGITNGVAFNAAATATYTVTGTDANGCTGTATKTVTVNTLPTVTATSAPASGTICSGATATLTGGGASTYSWTGGVTNGTAFTPSSTQTYTVTGTDANGCTNTATKTITVNPLPVLTNATTKSICAGTAVGLALTATPASTFSWVATSNPNVTGESTTNQTSSTINNTLNTTQTTAQTVIYSVTPTSGGCAGTPQTITITVNPKPAMTSANTTSICSGQTLAFALTANQPSTFTWAASSSATVTGESTTPQSGSTINNTLSTASATAQTVTYSAIPTSTTGSCVGASQSITVTVNINPTVTASSVPSSGAVCNGSTVVLNGGGAATYSWSGGATNGVAYTPVAGTYTVTGTDANGCTNTATQTITINALPAVTASAGSTVCAGSSVTLNGGGAVTYSWTGGITDGVAFTASSTQTYTVTGTDANGCSNTATALVTVNTLPNVSVNGTTAVCTGDATTLSGSGASTYSWTGGITDGVAFTPSGTQTYTVTGTDANGCSNTAIATVTVNSLPAVTANANSTVCSGSSVTLNGGGAANYSWTGGITDGVAFTATSTQTYTVTGTDANGCSNTATTTVSVNPLPATPTVTQNGTDLVSSAASGNQWYYNGSPIAGETNPTITPTQNGNYTVVVTDANGCSATSTVFVMNTIGIKEQYNSGFAATVIPNPNNGAFTLVVNNPQVTAFTIAVKNVLGQVISMEQISGSGISKAMDLSGYGAGVYFIHLSASSKQFVTRVIVE